MNDMTMAPRLPGRIGDLPGETARHGIDLPRAVRALRRLLADNDDTAQVFEIMRALNTGSARDGYIRMIEGPVGARLAYERVELETKLMDPNWLAQFKDGTVGAAYRDFVGRENLSAEGLAQVSKVGVAAADHDQPDPIAWYARRVRDVHDMWHVMTGYGRDPLGEACLVGFSYSQTRGLGWLLIALGAMAKGRAGVKGVRGAVLEGFRHGRQARWLPGLDYERLMAMPLAAARRELGIREPKKYRAVLDEYGAAEGYVAPR